MRCVRPLASVTIVLVISACAPLQTAPSAPVESRQPGQTSPVQKRQQAASKKIAPARKSVNPAQKAVTSLLQEGWAYYREGSNERSIAVAERAQRLDPQRAEIYLLLASSYLAQGKTSLAGQMGQRGLSLSQGDVVIRRKLQGLLAQIRGATLSEY